MVELELKSRPVKLCCSATSPTPNLCIFLLCETLQRKPYFLVSHPVSMEMYFVSVKAEFYCRKDQNRTGQLKLFIFPSSIFQLFILTQHFPVFYRSFQALCCLVKMKAVILDELSGYQPRQMPFLFLCW